MGGITSRPNYLWMDWLQGILVCMEYKPPKNIQDTKEEATLKAFAIKSEFFQVNTVTEICSRYTKRLCIVQRQFLIKKKFLALCFVGSLYRFSYTHLFVSMVFTYRNWWGCIVQVNNWLPAYDPWRPGVVGRGPRGVRLRGDRGQVLISRGVYRYKVPYNFL